MGFAGCKQILAESGLFPAYDTAEICEAGEAAYVFPSIRSGLAKVGSGNLVWRSQGALIATWSFPGVLSPGVLVAFDVRMKNSEQKISRAKSRPDAVSENLSHCIKNERSTGNLFRRFAAERI